MSKCRFKKLAMLSASILGAALIAFIPSPPMALASPDFGPTMTASEIQFVADMKDAGVSSKVGSDMYIVVAGYLLCRSIATGGVSPQDMRDIINYIEYRDYNVVSAIAENDLCPGGVFLPRV